jgi:hypothetical protein
LSAKKFIIRKQMFNRNFGREKKVVAVVEC